MSKARSVVYSEFGGPEVLRIVERDVPAPASGQVLVKIVSSGINPTDWKNRQGGGGVQPTIDPAAVPHHDGAGIIEAVGDDVEGFTVGDRVWVVLAAYGSPTSGTAQEFAAISADRVFHLPDEGTFEQGASLGIPALTAHRALTVAEDLPNHLAPGSLQGSFVLISGGAGGVGHAAIQLATWAGATVMTTVSSEEKGELARAAGARYVLTYTDTDIAEQIRAIAPNGVDLVVEVAIATNLALDMAVLAERGTIAVYGNDRGGPLVLDFYQSLLLNVRLQFVLLYTVGGAAMARGAADINLAVADAALGVGVDAGLPIHQFGLHETAAAHTAAEGGLVGKAIVVP